MKPCINEIKWIELNSIVDDRGALTSIEGATDIPFEIKRIFYMHDVTKDRGGHAHLDTDQVIIGVGGTFKVDISDGVNKLSFIFNDKTRGLYVPRLLFTWLYDFSVDAVSLVLANTHYEFNKSFRTWESYLSHVNDSLI